MNNVPNLRFKEFSDEWEEKCLSSFLSESKIKGDTGDIAHKLTVKLWAKGIVEKREDLQGSSETQYYVRKAGQLMYGKLDFLNCAFGIVPEELDGFQSTLDAPAFDVYNANSSFLLNRIIQKNFYKKNGDIADGSRKAKRVHVDTFLGMKIFIPTLKEQEKIASFFSLIDKKIELQTEKVEELKNYKKGIMQKIFSQELRFKDENGNEYPEWEERKLRECMVSRVQKQVPSEEAPLMAFTSKGGIEAKGERYDRGFLVKDETKLYKRTELNDFIYSSNNLDVGSIGLNKYGTAVISDVYEIFEIKNNVLPVIINAIINKPDILYKILKYRQGALYGQYRIHAEDFLNVGVCIPSYKEQEKLAIFLSLIDEKIDLEIDKLEQLQLQKKGLLQQMFI